MAGVVIRQLRSDDAAAFEALVARATGDGDLTASADPHGAFTARIALRDPAETLVAELDGRLVGFGIQDVKVTVVEPAFRRRGIGRSLVAAGDEVVRRLERDAQIMGVLPADAAGHAFLDATGFAFHSTVWDLDAGPDVAVAAPAWPVGVRVRPIGGRPEARAWANLFNDAFSRHATPLQIPADDAFEDWGSPFPGSDDDIALAEDAGGRLLGFCCAEPRRLPEGSVEPRAEIWTIGVRSSEQGRGLGRQLLRWGVGYLRGLGVVTVTLAVNGINARALGLYESEGFVRTTTRERWARPVAATASGEG